MTSMTCMNLNKAGYETDPGDPGGGRSCVVLLRWIYKVRSKVWPAHFLALFVVCHLGNWFNMHQLLTWLAYVGRSKKEKQSITIGFCATADSLLISVYYKCSHQDIHTFQRNYPVIDLGWFFFSFAFCCCPSHCWYQEILPITQSGCTGSSSRMAQPYNGLEQLITT